MAAAAGLRAVDACSSSALLIRAATWDEVGGLDDDFFPAGHVDQDLAMRIRRHGQVLMNEPRARTSHQRSTSTTRRYQRFIAVRNALRFRERWRTELERDHEPPGELAGKEVARALGRAEAARRVAAERPPPAARTHDAPAVPYALDAGDAERLAAALQYSERHLRLRLDYEAELEPALEHFETQAGELVGVNDRLRVELEKTRAALQAIVSGGWWRLRERLLPLARLAACIRRC